MASLNIYFMSQNGLVSIFCFQCILPKSLSIHEPIKRSMIFTGTERDEVASIKGELSAQILDWKWKDSRD